MTSTFESGANCEITRLPEGNPAEPVRFSVVVTCFNQRHFIGAAVESVLRQSCTAAWDVIVVDDGSTDGSAELLQSFDSAITLVTLPSNCGAIAARNHGAALASGEYLVFLDGDDVLRPDALAVYERIVASRRPRLMLARTIWFSDAAPPVSEDSSQAVEVVEYATFLQKDRPIGLCASAYIVARRDFEMAGGWTPGIFHLDLVDLSTKLGVAGKTLLICSPATVFYRIHEGNSIYSVTPFLQMARHILNKERAGQYPGGHRHWYRRHAWLGGTVVFWTKRAFRAGYWKAGMTLAMSGWTMVLAAILSRTIARLKGRRPVETLPM